MHKSTGNFIGANDAMATYGADVLRLWLASVESAADMRVGAPMLKAASSVYRNWRNRLRMLLGLIDDLRPEELVAREALEPIDQLALAKLDDTASVVRRAYKEYRLHDVYLALVDYDTSDLSSFYIDVLKDPMYSGPRGGARRKSAQTALFAIFEALCAMLAPLLSFTAEEAWQHVPESLKGARLSVFDLQLPHGSERGSAEETRLALYELLKRLRAVVAASEGPRDFQLQARVFAAPALEPKLRALGDNLREALVVSDLVLETDPEAGEGARVVLSAAAGGKCSRCWKTLPLGSDALHPTVCGPCAAILRTLDPVA
jgi:isoleucyl-tRNA synthetase